MASMDVDTALKRLLDRYGVEPLLFYTPRADDITFRKAGYIHLAPHEGWDVCLVKPPSQGVIVAIWEVNFADKPSAENCELYIIQSGEITTGYDFQSITPTPGEIPEIAPMTVADWHHTWKCVVDDDKRFGFRVKNNNPVLDAWLSFEVHGWFIKKERSQIP